MSKFIIGIVALVLIGAGLNFYYRDTDNPLTPSTPEVLVNPASQETSSTTPSVTSEISTTSNPTVGTVKSFVVNGKNFSFSPTTIMVKKGDKVKITFKDDDGFHDLKIDGYNVSTQRISTGGESSVEFVADKVGSFEYYCTVGNHREKGMTGTFTVTQ